MSDQEIPNSSSYQRQTPHISQEPIDDIPTEYVMPNRYTTVDQAGAQRGRRNMGVASNDPDYLPRTPGLVRDDADAAPGKVKQPKTNASGFNNYDRYLQTPKSGKSIFTSRQRRRQKHLHQAAAVAVVAVAIVLIILLFAL